MTDKRVPSEDEIMRDACEFIRQKYGVAGAMVFVARHYSRPGADYTRDRDAWLPRDDETLARLDAEAERAIAKLPGKKVNGDAEPAKRKKSAKTPAVAKRRKSRKTAVACQK